ncbi:MAG: NAD-dependent epimerase/dehydratase family protein [Cytophagales bacterium]|nr:NAD-dependent epimerase/dehydratase family protein [Cytophagales bacterium]
MHILITGGAGFAGSSLAFYLKEAHPEYSITCLDNLKRRGSELNIPRLKQSGIEFLHGDIRNKEDFDGISKIDVMIEASAEPSVLAGINSTPDYLINTNLAGTINCLNVAVKHQAKFIFLSTSRIYPIRHLENIKYTEAPTRFEVSEAQKIPGISPKGLSEDFPLDGYRSLYGTTKLASELIIQEYNHFYNMPAVINRCGVLTGPWQMGKIDQGVVVLWAARHFWKIPLSYIGFGGKGKQVRDILHVHDLYRLIEWQLGNFDKVNGEIYNVGGGKEVSVSLQELTSLCEEASGNKISITKVSENRQADIPIYLSDCTKIQQLSGWKPLIGPLQIMKEITQWIGENEKDLEKILR